MRHTTALRAVALGVLLSSAAATTPTLAQRAPRGARRGTALRNCVQFTQQNAADGRSITLELQNRCTVPVEGSVSWRLACGESESGTPIEHNEPLQPGQRRILVANGEACGATGFRISDIHWSWRPQSVDSEAP